MKQLKRYLVPSLIVALLLLGLALAGYIRPKSDPKKKPVEYEVPQLPHGRVLYVVVEEDGIYVGQEFVAFPLFPKFLEEGGRKLKPEYALVLGTEGTRYGRVAEVFNSIKDVLKISASIVTTPTPNGTRRGPIEVHENWWLY